MADRDDILRKVQAILNKAESTNFDEERDALLAKADELMFRYAIESYEIDAARGKANRKEQIVQRSFEIGKYDLPTTQPLIDLVGTVAYHTRCRHVFYGLRKGFTTRVSVVGFETDAEYCEMLYTSLFLQIMSNIEPKPDPSLTYEENVVMLLRSGQSRRRAAELLGVDLKKEHSKMSAIYKKWCLDNDVPYVPKGRPIGNTYAVNFMQGFVSKVSERFYEIRKTQESSVEGTGTELALRDRKAEVKDAFDDMFPDLRAVRARAAQGKFNAAARARGTEAGSKADLGQKRMRQDRKALS